MASPTAVFERAPERADRRRARASHGQAPDPDAVVEPVCCWCQSARAARFDDAAAPRVRFGICRDCLESRLREITEPPRPRARS